MKKSQAELPKKFELEFLKKSYDAFGNEFREEFQEQFQKESQKESCPGEVCEEILGSILEGIPGSFFFKKGRILDRIRGEIPEEIP